MKTFLCCLIAIVFSLALADVKNVKENKVANKLKIFPSDENSDSKSKRDAFVLIGNYHGPSFKYLPPVSASSNNFNSRNIALVDGHSPAFRGSYSLSGIGSGHSQSKGSSFGHHVESAVHDQGHTSASYPKSGHHGLDHSSPNYHAGHGSTHHSGNFKADPSNDVSIGHDHIPGGPFYSYAIGHGHSSSSLGTSGIAYKPQLNSLSAGHVIQSVSSGSNYHNYKGNSDSYSPLTSSEVSTDYDFGSSHGTSLSKAHHSDHVHNGGQEHHYIVSNRPAGFGGSSSPILVGHQGDYTALSTLYLPPAQQHSLPSKSYGVPKTTEDAFSLKHTPQLSTLTEHKSAYTSGDKGLRHFGFIVKKPQVLHTTILEASFKQPSYSKAPFKPSTFLGAKFEGSTLNQKYSTLGGETDYKGYDYPVPSGPSIIFQEPSYQPSVEVKNTPIHEPLDDSHYLTPNNKEGSFKELSSASSSNYLPPSNTYGVPYPH